MRGVHQKSLVRSVLTCNDWTPRRLRTMITQEVPHGSLLYFMFLALLECYLDIPVLRYSETVKTNCIISSSTKLYIFNFCNFELYQDSI